MVSQLRLQGGKFLFFSLDICDRVAGDDRVEDS